jgi:hypothetical protein
LVVLDPFLHDISGFRLGDISIEEAGSTASFLARLVAILSHHNYAEGGRSMKLPDGEDAIVDLPKLRDYCLSQIHPRGRHKARVFLSALAMTAADAEELRATLLNAARERNALPGASDTYGDRYIIDFELTRSGKAAKIRSSWIVLTGESAPRFVTCFVL